MDDRQVDLPTPDHLWAHYICKKCSHVAGAYVTNNKIVLFLASFSLVTDYHYRPFAQVNSST